ncbi:MAG: FAA hydrolase family protein [Acidobacteria bacterium]|nr:MAG: FAA hydrolase family protein [Acidobacteriota bacterium]REK07713.1 MAG: FAA hydrolase family protein [Acidobacteriota bacterium]
MKNAFQPRCRPSLSIVGSSDRFPVRRIYCVGRNYREHAREMGDDPSREPPFFFSKPADALLELAEGEGQAKRNRVFYPPRTKQLHHEVELVAALGRGGFEIAAEVALEHVFAYALGNDLTRRDLQAEAKEKRRPWDLAKGFDGSALCGPLHGVGENGHLEAGRIWLEVAGELRQEGDIGEMIWSVAEIVADLSTYVRLHCGDLIYTGTPAGVGGLEIGDSVRSGIEGLAEIEFQIVEPQAAEAPA